MPEFELDSRLASDSLPVADLGLCSVRLMNDRRFPWLLLVPRRPDCVELLDLEPADQGALWGEILTVCGIMKQRFAPDKLNVATLGNQVAQLHIHIIARFRNDAAWPRPVWGVGQMEPWGDDAPRLIARLAAEIRDAL